MWDREVDGIPDATELAVRCVGLSGEDGGGGLMKMFWNQVLVTITQPCEYTKNH